MAPSDAILITGCSTGIGRATAERLARAGRTVYATARSVGSVAPLQDAGCRTLALDVTDEASMERAVRTVEDEHGAVGVLINNAGYSQSGALETLRMASVRRQFETNVFGALRLSQLVLPAMRAQRSGVIVNISSMGGRLTFPGGGAYHGTKYALEALSDAMRSEVRPFGVKVILIEPGLIVTEFGRTAERSVADTADDDAYAAFNAAVGERTRSAYEAPWVKLIGGGPDRVARVIAKAIDAPNPRARYRVTPSATMLIALRRVLPDRLWDRFAAVGVTPPSG